MMEEKESTVLRDDSNPTAPTSGAGVGAAAGTGVDEPVHSTTNGEAVPKADVAMDATVNHARVGKEDKKKKKKKKSKKSKKSKKNKVESASDSYDSSDSSDSSSDSSDSDSGEEESHKRSKKNKKKKKSLGRGNYAEKPLLKELKPKSKSKSSSTNKTESSSDDSSSDSSCSDVTKGKGGNSTPDQDKQSSVERIALLERRMTQMQAHMDRGTTPAPFPSNPIYGGLPPYGYNVQQAPFQVPLQTPLQPPPPPPPGHLPGMGRKKLPPLGSGHPHKRVQQPLYTSSDEEELEKPKTRRKKPIKAEFKRVDWIWDTSLYTFKLQDTAETSPVSQYDEYIFHVRRTFDPEGKYRKTFVDIKSKLLRECLQEVIGNVQGVSLVDETPKLDPNLLFLYIEDFKAHRKHLKQAKITGDTKKQRKKNATRLADKQKHLKVLIKYIDTDFAKVKDSLYPMLKNGLITYDLLWALWKPGTLAYTTTYGSVDLPRVFKVEGADRQMTMTKGDFYFIDGKYFEYDGKRFGHGNVGEEIGEFSGARRITSLPCYPLQYHKNEQQVRKELIERGKKFVSLCGVHYKSYTGMAYMKRRKTIIRFNIQNSRIMVDPAIFRRMNPNYYVSLVRSKDQDGASGDSSENESGGGCGSSDSDDSGPRVKYVMRIIKDKDGKAHLIRVPKEQADDFASKELATIPGQKKTPESSTPNEEGTEDETKDGTETAFEIPDEDYMIASPVVLGFAFSEKQWLEFEVANVNEIKWNDGAWDSLVLEPSTKDLIKALVESRKFNAANTIDDVIQGKGKGLVTVLHGPPGTGKTLTAEGISELLKCPLYMASAGELGTDSRLLESELQKILDICHTWGAILLLDEADVFLEKRNMQDIHRNALVSIFLRQLEYFQGILFLTTNRVETFDEAFQSRIHIALRYDALDAKAKKAIFKLFIDRVRAHGKLETKAFDDNDLNTLAKHDLNGREIKNVLGSAQDLAINKGEALGMKHIRQVLDVHAKFGRDLKGGSGFEDAMRSYF